MDDSPFSKLSAELRNQIYTLALTSAQSISITDIEGSPEQDAAQPAITRTCKEMRSECLLLFYSTNKFAVNVRFQSSIVFIRAQHNIAKWLTTTPKDCRQSIAKLLLYFEWQSPGVAFEEIGLRVQEWVDFRNLLHKVGLNDGTRVSVQSTFLQTQEQSHEETKEFRGQVEEMFEIMGLKWAAWKWVD